MKAILTKHGHCSGGVTSSEYGIFSSMWERCSNPNNAAWKNYGGRGITVDPRWAEFTTFLADMGLRPGKKYTLERSDNDKGYSPENCVWATRGEQSRNHRRNRRITCQGRTLILREWIDLLGTTARTIDKLTERCGSAERAIEALAASRGVSLAKLSLPPE
jgi:hypothetical protein